MLLLRDHHSCNSIHGSATVFPSVELRVSVLTIIVLTCFVWQDRAVFFEMVWEASEWDFNKKEGFTFRLLQFTMDNEGNQKKCEEVCEPWNEFCMAELKEVIQAGRDAFAWQKKPEALKHG